MKDLLDVRALLTPLVSVVLAATGGCSTGPTCEPVCSDGVCEPGSWVALCPATYTMGPEPGDVRHEVTLTGPFEILTTEVTQQMFTDLMGFNPSGFVEGSECDWCERALRARLPRRDGVVGPGRGLLQRAVRA